MKKLIALAVVAANIALADMQPMPENIITNEPVVTERVIVKERVVQPRHRRAYYDDRPVAATVRRTTEIAADAVEDTGAAVSDILPF